MTQSETSTVTLNFLTPGFCHSELTGDAGWGLAIMKFFFARSTEVGSRTVIAAACAGHDSHGQYLVEGKIAEPSAFVLSEEGSKTQKRVWDELNAKLEKIQPGILSNI